MNIYDQIGLIVVVASILVSLYLLTLARGGDTPKQVDFLVAISLLILSAIALGILFAVIDSSDEEIYAKEIQNLKIAAFIIPFFTAGIATNIISHIFLHNKIYSKRFSYKENKTVIWEVIGVIFWFCAGVFSVVNIIPYIESFCFCNCGVIFFDLIMFIIYLFTILGSILYYYYILFICENIHLKIKNNFLKLIKKF